MAERYGLIARIRLDGSGGKEVVVEGRWEAGEDAFGKRWLVLRKDDGAAVLVDFDGVALIEVRR